MVTKLKSLTVKFISILEAIPYYMSSPSKKLRNSAHHHSIQLAEQQSTSATSRQFWRPAAEASSPKRFLATPPEYPRLN